MQTAEQQLLIREEQHITPAVGVLNEIISAPPEHLQPTEVSQSVSDVLEKLFPEQEYEEKTIQMAKEILGDIAKEYSPEELKCAIIEMQYLIDTWLDDFEKKIFNGMTLKELLHEKGGQ